MWLFIILIAHTQGIISNSITMTSTHIRMPRNPHLALQKRKSITQTKDVLSITFPQLFNPPSWMIAMVSYPSSLHQSTKTFTKPGYLHEVHTFLPSPFGLETLYKHLPKHRKILFSDQSTPIPTIIKYPKHHYHPFACSPVRNKKSLWANCLVTKA